MKITLCWVFCLITFKTFAQPPQSSLTASNIANPVLAESPLYASTTENKVLGFSAANSGSVAQTIAGITVTGIGSDQVSSATISSFDAVGRETRHFSVSTVTATNSITFGSDAGSITVPSGETLQFYLVIAVKSGINSQAPEARPTISIGDITSPHGVVLQSEDIISRRYSFHSNATATEVIYAGRDEAIGLNVYSSPASVNLFGIKFSDVRNDATVTTVQSLTFSIARHGNLATVALFDNNGEQVGENVTAASTDGTVVFENFGYPLFSLTDGGTKTLFLKASFAARVNDHDCINIALTNVATATGSTAIGPITNIRTNTDLTNKIDVVAVKQQASPNITGEYGEAFGFSIRATDAAGNTDADYVGSVAVSKVSAAGTLTAESGGSLTQAFLNGVALFTNLMLSEGGQHTLRSAVADSAWPAIEFLVLISGVAVAYIPRRDVTPYAYCSKGNFISIGKIVITESTAADFSAGNANAPVTLKLLLPPGFIFNSEVTSGLTARSLSGVPCDISISDAPDSHYSYILNNNHTAVSIRFTVGGTSSRDELTIDGLMVRYMNNTPKDEIGGGDIVCLGGTAVIAGIPPNEHKKMASLKTADAQNIYAFGDQAATLDFDKAGVLPIENPRFGFYNTQSPLWAYNKKAPTDLSYGRTCEYFGAGITKRSPRAYFFNAAAAGAGNHEITCRVKETQTGQSCYTKRTKIFTVAAYGLPHNLKSTYCIGNVPRPERISATPAINNGYSLEYVNYYIGNSQIPDGRIELETARLEGDPSGQKIFLFPPSFITPDNMPSATWRLRLVYSKILEDGTRSEVRLAFTSPISFYATPTASFSGLTEGQKFCANNASVPLTGTPSGGTFSGSADGSVTGISYISSNTFVPGAEGIRRGIPLPITYKYTTPEGCTAVAPAVNVTVYDPPVPVLQVREGLTYCRLLDEGGAPQAVTVDFKNTTDTRNMSRVTWSFGDVPLTILEFIPSDTGSGEVSHSYPNAGEYLVKLIIDGDGGCRAETSATVRVGTTPSPAIAIANLPPRGEFCSNDLSGNGKLAVLNISSGTNRYKIVAANASEADTEAARWVIMPSNVNTFKLKQSGAVSPDFNYSAHVNERTKIIYKNTEYLSGCSNSKEIFITAYAPPVADFTTNGAANTRADGGALCLSTTEPKQAQGTYVNASKGWDNEPATASTVTAWKWNFGVPSATGEGMQGEYTYTAVGTYSVSLEAAGRGGCKHTAVKRIIVGNTPVPRFTGLQHGAELCRDDLRGGGKEVALHTPSGSANAYKVNGGEYKNIGERSSFYLKDTPPSANAHHEFDYSGLLDRTVRLLYKNTDDFSGCHNETSIDITVYSPPVVSFTTNGISNANADGGALCLAPGTSRVGALFGNTSKGWDNERATATTVTAWKWVFSPLPDGQGTEKDGVYDYVRPGTYSVSLEAAGRGGCTRTASKNIIVGNTPEPRFTGLQDGAELCSNALRGAGKEVTLHTPQGSVNAYKVGTGEYKNIGRESSFFLKNVPVSADASREFNYSGFINHRTRLTYKNTDNFSGCLNETFIDVTVYSPPTPSFTTNASAANALCRLAGQPVTGQFTNTTLGWDGSQATDVTSTTVTAWKWNFGASSPNGRESLMHGSYDYTEDGTYLVSLEATGIGGCTSIATSAILIREQPAPSFTSLANGAELCRNILEGTGKEVTLHTPSGSTNAYKVGDGAYKNIGGENSFFLKNVPVSADAPREFDYSGFINRRTRLTYKNTDNSSGCENETYIDVTIYDPPVADFTIAGLNANNALCRLPDSHGALQAARGAFTNTTQGWDRRPATDITVTAWKWDFDAPLNGRESLKRGSYDYTEAGTYLVSLEATGKGGCKHTKEQSLVIGDTPNPQFLTTRNDFCSDELTSGIVLNLNLETGANSFSVNNEAYAAIAANPYITLLNAPPTSGRAYEYDYRGRIGKPTVIKYQNVSSLGGCRKEISKTIVAYKPPIAAFDQGHTLVNSQGKQVLCLPLLTDAEGHVTNTSATNHFTDRSTTAEDNNNGTISSRLWDFGDNTAPSGEQNPTHTYSHSNLNGEVTLRIVGSGGCESSATKDLLIGRTPNPKFLTTREEFCADELTSGIVLDLNLSTDINHFSVNHGAYIAIAAVPRITLVNTSSDVAHKYDYRGRIGKPTVIKYKNVGEGECHNETAKTIVAYKLPTPAFEFDPDHMIVNSQGKNVLCLPLGRDVEGNVTNIPVTKRFTDRSTAAEDNNGGTINSRLWNFGDATSTEQNPTHTYSRSNSTGQVTLRIVGSGGCVNALTKDLWVGRKPNPRFLSESFYNTAQGGANYCSGDLDRGIVVDLSLGEGNNEYRIKADGEFRSLGARRTFTIYGSQPPILENNYVLEGSANDFNRAIPIVYRNTEHVTECTNSSEGRFRINRLPSLSFSKRKRQNGEAENFHCLPVTGDQGTDFKINASPEALALIADQVTWNFGDGVSRTESKLKSVNHIYGSPGEHRVQLEVKGRDLGTCRSTDTEVFPVVHKPIADFHVARLCAREGTEFKFTTALPLKDTTKTKASYKFDFGHGGPPVKKTLNPANWEGDTESNLYQNPGRYLVKLKVTDSIVSGGASRVCVDSTKLVVQIVPQVTDRNYFEPFEEEGGKWMAQGWVNHVEFGTDWNYGAQRTLDERSEWPPNSGEHGLFWSTRKRQRKEDGTYTYKYESSQRSALYSPCFDLRARGYYPIMSFDYFTQWADEKDGVCLEYSHDGKIWTPLPKSNLGRNWYNNAYSISGLVKRDLRDGAYGYETNQAGWTKEENKEGNGWVTAKYDLSGAEYKKKIRFRFLFGTNDDKKEPGDNGFALDNFSVYQRNTIALGEHFLGDDNAADPDRFFDFNKQDTLLIKLSYFTALGNSGNPEYLSNTADPDARAIYYGVASPPRSFISGANKSAPGKATVDLWGPGVFSEKILDNSPIDIDIQATLKNPTLLKITPKLHALMPIPKGTWVVHTALVENVNGREIMRKLLPHAAGVPLTAEKGRDPQEFEQFYRWDKGNLIKDPSKAGVIVFVQNLDTKSVMQASYKSLKNLPPPTITGFENYSNEASLYPNPAGAYFYLDLPFSHPTRVTVYNMAGQATEVPYTQSGRRIKADVSALTDGVYAVEARSEKGVVQKKLTKILGF